MFDDNYLNALAANYTPGTTQKKPVKQQKKKNPLTAFISEGGATGGALGGAAIGTALLPGIGTVLGGAIGGLAGGFGGSVAEQKIRDNNVDFGKAALEGGIGAVSAVPPLGALRGIKAANAVRGVGGSLSEALKAGGEATVAKAGTAAPGRIATAAQQAGQKGAGLTVGQSMGRGQVLTPDKADTVYDFITNGAQKYGGIRSGKPINQARDAQNVFNNVVGSLDNTLSSINRPVTPDETGTIFKNALGKVTDDASVTGATKTLEKFGSKIQASGNDLTKLEKIRREADDLAFTSTGAGKTSAAAQARAVRDAIDEFITPLSPEYKATKGDYSLAKEALDATSKANKNAKGINLPLTNTEVGAQTISGAKNKAVSLLGGRSKQTAVPEVPPSASVAKPTARAQSIPVTYMPSTLQGIGVQNTSRNTLTNPTVGSLSDALADMQSKGFKVSQKLGTTRGSQLPTGIGVAPDFTPLQQSPRLPAIEITGNKTGVKFRNEQVGTPELLQGSGMLEARRNTIERGKNLAGLVSENTPQETKLRSNRSMGLPAMAARQTLGSALYGFDPQEAQSTVEPLASEDDLVAALNANMAAQQPATNPLFDPAQVQANVAQILQNGGDLKDAAQYLGIVESIQGLQSAGAGKPLSAEASKVVANAQSGLDSLGQLEGMISQGGVPKGTLLPGRSAFGGLGAALAGTSSYDTAARNIADVITRLRTGAALTEQEAAFYNSQLPQAFDDPDTVAQKLSLFRNLFSSIGSRTGTTGNELQSALMQS